MTDDKKTKARGKVLISNVDFIETNNNGEIVITMLDGTEHTVGIARALVFKGIYIIIG